MEITLCWYIRLVNYTGRSFFLFFLYKGFDIRHPTISPHSISNSVFYLFLETAKPILQENGSQENIILLPLRACLFHLIEIHRNGKTSALKVVKIEETTVSFPKWPWNYLPSNEKCSGGDGKTTTLVISNSKKLKVVSTSLPNIISPLTLYPSPSTSLIILQWVHLIMNIMY